MDYSRDRPLEGLCEAKLFLRLEEALYSSKIDLEVASLVCQQLRETGGKVRDARRMIARAGGRELRWLTGARYRVRKTAENYAFESGARNCKVYFILLTEDRETPVPWGLYIGQTFRRIETRFKQHLDPAHPHRSRVVTQRGWQLLHSLSSLLPAMTRDDSLRIEASLLASFRGEPGLKPLRTLRMRRVKGG